MPESSRVSPAELCAEDSAGERAAAYEPVASVAEGFVAYGATAQGKVRRRTGPGKTPCGGGKHSWTNSLGGLVSQRDKDKIKKRPENSYPNQAACQPVSLPLALSRGLGLFSHAGLRNPRVAFESLFRQTVRNQEVAHVRY